MALCYLRVLLLAHAQISSMALFCQKNSIERGLTNFALDNYKPRSSMRKSDELERGFARASLEAKGVTRARVWDSFAHLSTR